MKVILKVENKAATSEIPMELHGTVVLGRSSKADHKIPDELMSGTHCRVTLNASKLVLVDLNSKNGTYLNGIRIEHAEVFLGDEIKIGGTKITILSQKMDAPSVQALTFPGPAIDRGIQNLQLDFTGARTINQSYLNSPTPDRRPTAQSINKEIETRIKAQSKIKLSKQEIKIKNKKMSSLASTFDYLLLILALALPLLIVNLLVMMHVKDVVENRLIAIIATETIVFAAIYTVNFKMLKFTIGEKMAGIEKKYRSQ